MLVVKKPKDEISIQDVRKNEHHVCVVMNFGKAGRRVYLPVQVAPRTWRLLAVGSTSLFTCEGSLNYLGVYDTYGELLDAYTGKSQSNVFAFRNNAELGAFIAEQLTHGNE